MLYIEHSSKLPRIGEHVVCNQNEWNLSPSLGNGMLESHYLTLPPGSIIHIYNGAPSNPSGPAIIRPDGMLIWAMYGQIHRVDAPAIMSNEVKVWMRDNVFHREGAPAVVEPSSEIIYASEGAIQRRCGPAVLALKKQSEFFEMMWFWKNKVHSVRHPAIIRDNGQALHVVEGKPMSKTEWGVEVPKWNLKQQASQRSRRII